MSQHDMDIGNGTGAAVRADINLALLALVSNNSGASAPSPSFAYMLWPDTTTGWLKQRNAANSAWIEVFRLSDIAFKDSTFAVVDDSDVTKKLILQLSSITTGQTRTITVPDASITLAGINLAQTWTATQVPDNGTASVSTTSSVAFDGSDQVREITFTNAITATFAAPTGIAQHAMYVFKLKAGDTSARTFAWNAAYKFPAATPPLTSGTITNGAFDVITFIGGASNTLIYQGHQADVR